MSDINSIFVIKNRVQVNAGEKAEGELILWSQNEFYSYKAITGPWGKGPLPVGEYNVVSCFDKEDTEKNKAYKRDGVPWLAGLIPLFETDRDNLAIHPDGNVPGSLGCIVLLERDMEARMLIKNMLIDHKIFKLKVGDSHA